MTNIKRVLGLLSVYFFVISLIPASLLNRIVNAEESIPMFLDYKEGYISSKMIYKDNVICMLATYDYDSDWTYVKDGKTKNVGGYISDYLGGAQYILNKEEQDERKEYVFDLDKGENVGEYTYKEQVQAVKNKFGKNLKVDMYHIYGGRWYQYYADIKDENSEGLVSPSNKVIGYGHGYNLDNSVTDKTGDNIYTLFSRGDSDNKFIKIINKDGSIKEFTLTDNAKGDNYRIISLYVYHDSLCALVANSKYEVTVSKIDFDNNTAKLGNVIFSKTKNGFTQDINGDFWTVEYGFVRKFVNNKWVDKYQVSNNMDSVAVYDDNNILLSGELYSEEQSRSIGIYKIINIASATETKPETPSSGNGQTGGIKGNNSCSPTTNSGSTVVASGSTSTTTTTSETEGSKATPTSATTENTYTQNKTTVSTINKAVVGTAKDGVLPVTVNKLDKDASNVIDVTAAASGNKVEVTIADTKAIKEGNGSLQVKAGQNELVNLPFSVVDKSLITDSSKLVLDTTVTDNTDIVKDLKAVKKLYSFDLTLVDGDKRTAIHKFANGSAEITINLSDEELKGLAKNNLAVFYYNEDTKKFELMDTKVDGNKVIFKTPHFSKFIIAEKSPNSSNSAQVLPKTGSTFGTMSLVILGTVLLLFGFITLVGKKMVLNRK